MKFSLSFPRRFSLCLLSACLVWFSFPNFICKTLAPPTAFMGWIALVPFFIALHETTPRQGALLGWFFGFAQFGGILYWIAFLEAAHYLSGPAWALLVFYLSLFSMVFGWLYRFADGVLGWGECLAPFFWVALEFIRGSRPWGGFSWGELGYSQAPYPLVLTLSSWAGVYGLTFLMVWANAAIARWILSLFEGDPGGFTKTSLWRKAVLGAPLVLVGCFLLAGYLEIKGTVLRKSGSVFLLQPSINQDVKWSKENEAATYNILWNLARGAKKSKPNLIIWPETAAPAFLLWTPSSLRRVLSIVKGSRAKNLVGCLDAQKNGGGGARYYNAAIQFGAGGRQEGIYHKRHLVPFGEFVPFQKYLTFLGPVVGDLGDFDFGETYRKFDAKGFTYTPMICYEVIFPGDVYQAFQTGADALVNISNDAWYGHTASPYQHAMMAVVRAAEERKPLLRAANTGICLATDPFGKILCTSSLFDRTAVEADVLLVPGARRTLYSRWGNWFPRLCWLVVVVLLTASLVKTKNKKPAPVPTVENNVP